MKLVRCRFLFLLLMIVFVCPIPARSDTESTVELTVVKNDTLINICGKYLENPGKWREIGRINHLRNFDLIRNGRKLIIPMRLLKGVPADGQVVFAKGDVTFLTASGGPWKALRQNDSVRQGNLIRTGQESAVEISFADGSAFFQRADTTLELHTSQLKWSDHLLQRFILSSGRILMKVRRATGRDSRIEIRTPSAAAVARGTDFRVSIGEKESTTSEVLEGKVDVGAMGRTVVVREREGTLVKKGKPPLEPRRLLPPPLPLELQSPYRSMPFNIKFERITGAVSYRFLLSKDQEGKDLVREKVIRVGEPVDISGLEDGSYYYQIRSIDVYGIEGFSNDPQKITVHINPLPPFIQEPVGAARHKGKSLTFRWLKVRDAVRYQLQIAPDPEFRQAPVNSRVVEETAYETTFDAYGTYYFRISSVTADGYTGIWSDAVPFTLVPPPPSPDVDKPALDKKEVHIRWRGQGEKMTYHCQIARDENFRTPIIDKRVEKPEIILARPDEPGVYYVHTSTIDPDGYEGGFSPPQSFEVKRRWPLGLAIFGGAVGVILLILL